MEAHPNELFPLIARAKTDKENHLTCETKVGKSQDVVGSLLNFFRLAVFKAEEMKGEKVAKARSQPNAHSKTTLRKKNKSQRNKARRLELKKRQKQRKEELRKRTGNQSPAKQQATEEKKTEMVAE